MTLQNRPHDDLLLAALQAAEAGGPAGEIVHWAAFQGDWLAAVASPASARLVLLPGGGLLWGDIPTGQRRYLTLGGQAWAFEAAEDTALGSYQFCRLAGAAEGLGDLATARAVCRDALALLGIAVPVDGSPAATAAPAQQPPQPVSRRGFLRALTGRR